MTNKPRRRIAGERSAAQRLHEDAGASGAGEAAEGPVQPDAPSSSEPPAGQAPEPGPPAGRVRPKPPRKAGLAAAGAAETVRGTEEEPSSAAPEHVAEEEPEVLAAPSAPDVWYRPAIVAAIVLFLGGAAMLVYGWSLYSDDGGEAAEARDREAEAVPVAAEAIETLFTFGEMSGEEYRAAFEPLATPHALESTEVGTYLDRVAQGVEEGVIAADVSPVVAAPIECGQRCEEDLVDVLVIFDHQPQVIGEGVLPPRHYRLQVQMRLHEGAWKVDDIDFLDAEPGDAPAP